MTTEVALSFIGLEKNFTRVRLRTPVDRDLYRYRTGKKTKGAVASASCKPKPREKPVFSGSDVKLFLDIFGHDFSIKQVDDAVGVVGIVR